MEHRNTYTVYYRNWATGKIKKVHVIATSKADAYDKAVYEVIPKIESELPYSSWVDSVTYQNGNCKYFNTSEGNSY